MGRLRAATIKEFDTIARLEFQAIDAYNDAHHYRAENPLTHLHEDEAPVETDKLKSFHFLQMESKTQWKAPEDELAKEMTHDLEMKGLEGVDWESGEDHDEYYVEDNDRGLSS